MRRLVVLGAMLGFIVFSFWALAASGTNLASGTAQGVMWDEALYIHWGLFLAPPPHDAALRTEAAAIHMTVRWSLSYVARYNTSTRSWEGEIDRSSLNVINTMEPSLSWVVPGKECATTLNHEQRHFDLNEVYRRKLDLSLSRLTATGASAEITKKLLKERIDATANQVLDALQAMQSRYDRETAHGMNSAEQSRWDGMIDAWLADSNQAPTLSALTPRSTEHSTSAEQGVHTQEPLHVTVECLDSFCLAPAVPLSSIDVILVRNTTAA